MDIKNAVKDQAQYPDIVKWFRNQKELDVEKLMLMVDTIGEMSDQIYEHYRAMCDMLKRELQKIRRACQENGCKAVYPERSEREKLSYVVEAACRYGAVLPEKYEGLLRALRN